MPDQAKHKPLAATPATVEVDDARQVLTALAHRIKAAGHSGKGCRMTAQETQLLTVYNLPCTGDDPGVMDGE